MMFQLYGAIVMILCILPNGNNSAWVDDPKCGESIYPDAGEGLSLLSARIVGGEESRPHEFPYQVLFTKRDLDTIFCGGVLITDLWVATAAHCMAGFTAKQLKKTVRIRLGAHNVKEISNPKPLTRKPKQVIIHEGYVASTFDNDIALVRMNKPAKSAKQGGRIRPACRPTPGEDDEDNTAIVSGWGSLSEGGELSGVLQYIPLEITGNSDCFAAFDFSYPITDSMVCALDGDVGDRRDACQGDSGGPMTVKRSDGRFATVGLVSWGIGCASGKPGVYTRISYMLDWIDEHI